MKIRYLLLGLMICVAGAGTINSSDGSFGGRNATPFLIFGHVWYGDGSPCSSPVVNITNADAAWYADTISGSDYYQTLLCGANVSLGDLLEFDVTDDVGFSNTSRVVNQDDLDNGGIFGFNLTLLSMMPRIVGFAPDSPVYDTENATRTFNITIDQAVDVTWLINGSPAQMNESVTDASYTHANVAIGVWNVSARASNGNGTDVQEWIWYVASSSTTSQPTAPFTVCGWMNYEGGGVYDNHTVNITNLNTGTRWHAETRAGCDYYELILDSGGISAGNVFEFEIADGVGYDTTNHTVTHDDLERGGLFDLNLTLPVLAPLVDVELTPDDDPTMPGVQVINPDYTTTNKTVTITANVTDPDDYKNITGVVADIAGAGTVEESPVSLTFVSNSSATTARYTGRFNMSDHNIGGYEVVVKATNTGGFTGTSSRSFTYMYEAPATMPPSMSLSPFIIYGYVSYDNGASCNSPFVVVTNLDTSEELVADNRTGESFYQLVTSSAFVTVNDTLKIEASKNGRPVGNATHTVSQTDMEQGVIEVNINERDLPDFTVTNLTFAPCKPLIGDLVTINATIANSGATEEVVFVEFCDNKSIKIERMLNDYPESPINDTITLPDVKRIRVHLDSFDVSSGGNITIYDETRLVEGLEGTGADYWTEWCDGGTIRLKSWNAGFTVDRYEAVLANESVLLGAGDSTNLSAKWNLSLQEMGWATNGTHNITVRVDPCDQVIESDETNNERTEVIDVDPSLDFAVTDDISLNPIEPVLGDVVWISANITNCGDRDGMTIVGVFYDNKSIEIMRNEDRIIDNENKSYTSTDRISLPPGVLGARLHFGSLHVFNGHVDICDKNGRVIERFHGMEATDAAISRWTDCIYTDNITVRIILPYNPNMATATHWCKFKIDRYEALIAEKPVTLNVTESKVINASWRTGMAYGGIGHHDITVRVDLHDAFVEINETNNTLGEQVFVNGTDLAVTAIEIPCGHTRDDCCYVGQDVNVTATIANIGAVDATNFTVIFRDGACFDCTDVNINTSGINFNETHIERLNSSESRSVSVRWNPLETGSHTITANITYNDTDNSQTNNELFNCSCVEPGYDFIVENVSVEPQKAEKGESVNITATIGSIGHAGGNVSVAFFVNSTDYAGTCGERFTRIRTIDDVEVNETETVSRRWDVDVAGGCHLIAAVVNPDNEIEEINDTTSPHGSIIFRGTTGDNVKNCTLHVNPLDLDITNITLDHAEPNIGDIVSVSAEIKNNGDVEANSTVWFYVERSDVSPQTPKILQILQPEEVMMRVHFNYIEWQSGWDDMRAYVNDSQDQRKPVYFYIKNEEGEMIRVPCIDFSKPCMEIMESDNIKWKHWDDVWTDWGYGDTFEIESGCWDPRWISIDKYQVCLGNRTVTLGPNESMIYRGTWNTSPPLTPGLNYTLMANVEDQKRYSKETYLGGTDLAVTNLSVKPVVWDGDKVWVNMTIENLGRMDATAFIVNFTEVYQPEQVSYGGGKTRKASDHLELINTTHIECLGAGNSIHIPVPWNASIRDIVFEGTCGDASCNWTEPADDYIIKVEIDPLENKNKEVNNTNRIESASVHVDESRDFEVTNLSFQVNNEYRDPSELVIYDDVTLNATLEITNFLNKGGSVNVSFYIDEACDEHEIGNTTISFPAGNGTGYAEIKWIVENFDGVDIPGNHDMTVVVDPEKRIYEIDDVNNAYIQSIYVRASDLLVKSLDIDPKNPERGEAVSINVTLANHGEADASDLILRIYDWAKRHIEDVDEQSGLGREQIEITRDNATAMRLYLDLEVGGGRVCIKDGSEREIIHYDENFHGWTPWVLDNSTRIVITDSAYARVSRVYYLASSDIIDTSTDIGVNETTKITVDWNPSVVGERFIAAVVDPENAIIESDEFNNRLAKFISVQAADLLVSSLSFTWVNGTEIGENEIIKNGDDVRIAANITNIDIEDAGSFDVRFLVDDILIEEETISDLANGSTISRFKDWNAIVGCHLIKVEADYKNKIDETNETNNIITLERYVCGANLSGNISWKTSGLHGDILFEPTQPYDEDEVNITATVNNSGYVAATNFSAALFFDYKPYTYDKPANTYGWWRWINRSYDDAVCIYLNISIRKCHILAINDRDGREVKKVDGSCWVQVPGDTASVTCGDGYCDRMKQYSSNYTISFYPVYPDNLSQIKELDANSSEKLPPVKQNVSVGDYPIALFIDPENKVSEDEDDKENNVIYKTMHVKPTRDFTITNVTGERMNLSDLDTIAITASVSNIGLRNGTAEAKIVDYEEEHRTYKYHFDANRSLSYLPIPPDATLLKSGYDDLMIIHRPGVDAINLHFNRITLYQAGQYGPPRGKILICNKTGAKIFGANGSHNSNDDPTIFSDKNILVPGTTTYIYTYRPSFDLDRYTTEKELLKEDVALNASKTWNESKNITSIRTAYTGNHTIAVTLDGDDRTAEINESNNELSPLFHVNASRDPVIVELNFTPEHPGDGDNVDITAVIANNRSKNASFTVDLWANLTRNKPDPDESLPDADLTTDMGGDRIRYITLLEHANLTLAPGENTTVNATWNDISVAGSPKYHIIAIVDPTDEIDEMNESNNEIVKEIIPNYPDLTIGTVQSGGGVKPVVPIIEIGGVSGASDVTVRFEAYETVECKKFIQNWDSIHHHDAVNMQVYFKHLRAPPPKGRVEVRDSTSTRVDSIKTYSGVEFSGKWSPWVEKDTVYIFCQGAGTYAEIDEYRWGNVSDNQTDLSTGGHKSVEIPWAYECPREINVTVDPDNNITEINEDNNNETLLLYADLKAEEIKFASPSSDKLSLDAEKFKIDGYITNGGGGGRNDIVYPVSDFNVTLEFRRRYQNGTVGDLVFNMTKYIEDPLCADKEMPIRFEFDPSEELEVGGNYTVFLIADSSGDVCESSELYPWGEYNNFTLENVYVYNTSGYTGGGDLVNVAQGEVNGRVVYTVGDEPSCQYSVMTPPGREKTVTYTGVVPKGSGNIEFARLFVYWFTWEYEGGRLVPVLAGMDATFNGQSLTMAGNYSDNPGATVFDAGYGLYSYDVTKYVTKGENDATVRITSDWSVGIHAIGLLVVYEDKDEPFTKYWVNEGADIMMAANSAFPTGLLDGDCITTATFDDVKREDTENVNASLLTVLGFYMAYGEPSDDALEFNGKSIGSRMHSHGMSGYWKYHYRDTGIALTKDRWEDVTDDLERGDNLAEIHSLGNYMMPNNAFLRLIFPPDLNIIDLTAPVSTVVGAHHSINATIRNDGRSDAHDFNATLEIDGRQMVRIPNLDLPAGENMTIHLYNWTPMLLLHSYNLTAAADVLSGEDWTEIETDNNALTKHVMIEEGGFGNQTGPRGTGGGHNPTGGEYTETITGRVIEGTTFSTFGGGGGAGMFSALEWIMKGAVWLVLLLLVCLGYWTEQRSYGRVSAGYAAS